MQELPESEGDFDLLGAVIPAARKRGINKELTTLLRAGDCRPSMSMTRQGAR
jgi:hypothetical protein